MNHSAFDGNFRLEPQGPHWRLRDAGGTQLLLQGAGIDACHAQRQFERAQVRWRADGGADVTLAGGGPPLLLHAAGVIVQQPLPDLYSSLPLAQYDQRTRRFWRRVFWLVRIPGGGALLKILAKRARAKA